MVKVLLQLLQLVCFAITSGIVMANLLRLFVWTSQRYRNYRSMNARKFLFVKVNYRTYHWEHHYLTLDKTQERHLRDFSELQNKELYVEELAPHHQDRTFRPVTKKGELDEQEKSCSCRKHEWFYISREYVLEETPQKFLFWRQNLVNK